MEKYSKWSKEELIQRIMELEKASNVISVNPGNEDIRHSLSIFQWVIEHSTDPIGMSTPEGKHYYQNKAFDDLFGDVGESPPDTLYVNKELGEKIFSIIKAGGSWTGEIELYDKYKSIITMLVTAYAVKDTKGKVINLVGVHTDISEKKAAETALIDSERKYRDLIDRTPDLLYRTNLQGEITYISPSSYKLSGYTQEEALGMKMAEEVYLCPKERDAFLKILKETGEVTNFEARLKRKDGSVWWASTNAHFNVDEQGTIVGVEGVTRDITKLKEAEFERQRLEDQLNREDKMRSLGLMAGGIAHDLNNILSGIVSYPDMLLLTIPKDSPLRAPIETIKNSGQRAADVVTDLLTIARGISTNKTVLNLNHMITEYIHSAEHEKIIKEHPSVSFSIDIDLNLLNLFGSDIHIKKILMNLVSNAVESIFAKGQITIRTENRYLDTPLEGYDSIRKGEYVLLSIEDNGSGISQDDLSRIFEPFYTKKVMGHRSGTGLGLTVVWNAVQDHDGYINVRSSSQGTAFEIYFQVCREESSVLTEAVPMNEIKGKGEKILVIDDEEQQRDIAASILKHLNYDVLCAASGEEAVNTLKQFDADLLILDMIMEKGMDGLDTYKAILKTRPHQKAIITSGYSKTKRVAEAKRLGVGAYIKKPYTANNIGITVRKELEAG